jgi:hypothetical protein
MRVVIDTSALRSEFLRKYLARSKQNEAIIPQWVYSECVRGDFRRSLRSLADYAEQISILKTPKTIFQFRPRCSGIHSRLIDERLTNNLRKNLGHNLASEGINAWIADRMNAVDRDSADSILANFVKFAGSAKEGMLDIESLLTEEELSAVRTRREILPSLFLRVARRSMTAAVACQLSLNIRLNSCSAKDAAYALQFRSMIAVHATMIDWCYAGGLNTRAERAVANDVVDATHIAFGSYFDGIMSNDKRLLRVMALCSLLLKMFFDSCGD